MRFRKEVIFKFTVEIYCDFEVIVSTIDAHDIPGRGVRDVKVKELWPQLSPREYTVISHMNGNRVEEFHHKIFVTIAELTPEVIVHELLHVCHIIMLQINMKLIRETEEPVAYLMGYLTKKTFEGLTAKK